MFGLGSFAQFVIQLIVREAVHRYSSTDDTLIDSKAGLFSSYNGHKRRKGVKVRTSVSAEILPRSLVLSPVNENDSKRDLLKF